MPDVYPFRAAQYLNGQGDVSELVAPPYDVLDAAAKDNLIAKNERNVVRIDLPHVPAKELGPDQAYSGAAEAYRGWLENGTLNRLDAPAMFAYRQTFEFEGARYQRRGMAVCVDAKPFGPRDGGGILPHEQTFSGPKKDRFALMSSTKCQFSPIFGLHADDSGSATAVLERLVGSRGPDMTADLGDGVTHEVWTINDQADVEAYQHALAGEDIFIADGHHRYNTALNYLASLEADAPLPEDHPAKRTMIVLVGMSDPGLVIGPTHRVLGGMDGYSLDAFKAATEGILEITDIGNDPDALEPAVEALAAERPGCVLGLIDFATSTCCTVRTLSDDPLSETNAEKPQAWRLLDVAIVQHLLVEQICQPKLNGGEPVKWAFPHSIEEVMSIGSGQETGAGGGAGFAQLAFIVRPTPLESVRDVSRANELMPQKSTFFYPKLATGLFINPLED